MQHRLATRIVESIVQVLVFGGYNGYKPQAYRDRGTQDHKYRDTTHQDDTHKNSRRTTLYNYRTGVAYKTARHIGHNPPSGVSRLESQR